MLQIFNLAYNDLEILKGKVENLDLSVSDFMTEQTSKKDKVGFVRSMINKRREGIVLSGLAAETEKIYTGLETTLSRLVKYFDGEIPKGENWPQLLISAASRQNHGIRKTIIDKKTAIIMDSLRAFRHKIRHVYAEDISPDHIIENAMKISRVYNSFVGDLLAFHSEIEPELNKSVFRDMQGSLLYARSEREERQ